MSENYDCNCGCVANQSAVIADLRRKLRDSEAHQVHRYHFASEEVEIFSMDNFLGSSVIIEITGPGRLSMGPVAIRNGLSPETIKAIKADLKRSFDYATEFKPS